MNKECVQMTSKSKISTSHGLYNTPTVTSPQRIQILHVHQILDDDLHGIVQLCQD